MSTSQKSVGVVLCTYNGEKYLQQQLESILYQTRTPEKILILDDGSRDRTVSIARKFANHHNYIQLIQNQANLGFTANFHKGIALCDTDFIALSDQDDIWLPQKIERLANELGSNPGCGLAWGDDEYMLADGTRTGYKLPESKLENLNPDQILNKVLELKWGIAGHQIMLDADLKKLILHNPVSETHAFDSWISLCAFFLMRPSHVPETLQLYRLHHDSAGGAIGAVLNGTPWEIHTKKKFDLPRLKRNIRRNIDRLRSPIKYLRKKQEKKSLPYRLATDRVKALDMLLEKRAELLLPPLSAAVQLFIQKIREECLMVCAGQKNKNS